MSKSDKTISSHSVRAGRDAVSSVKFPQTLMAAIDAWAEAHQATRSDAIRQLVELGLGAAPHRAAGHHDSLAIEALAVQQIAALLDPSLAPNERERRIRRLIDGPPEFCDERIDLPKHQM
ncbi:ribbon-helix-helix domain-containing protein [Bradyrhizobium sp. Tv2a-2]|uniref:ribbon-helix-helix domain-containing protein n=1 Tax=Bradyrhizobium sp. Tv2a-2 TaxID=113395 RepID=UPI00041F1E57|nr:ribbon-helix-helix domain-containing protein [Bradyrhizobium sp. Tv2a-2]